MPPLLLSARLRLRPPRPDDLDNIYRLGSDPRVMRYITPGRLQTLSEARADLERVLYDGRHMIWEQVAR